MYLLQFSIFVTGGIQLLSLTFLEMKRDLSPKNILLGCWILGTFIFSTYFNWCTNARTLLPMLPAVSILLIRRLDFLYNLKKRKTKILFLLFLMPITLTSLFIGYADKKNANAQKIVAEKITHALKDYSGEIYFQGHWGFQYYMESLGHIPFNINKPQVKKGDIIISPLNNTNVKSLGGKYYWSIGSLQIIPCPWLTTHSRKNKVSLYSGYWGLLPFVFTKVEPDLYMISIFGNFSSDKEAMAFFQENCFFP
ncbi:MAG: hypothetical protein U9O87_01650 [Verrucomicrobiota bacterium]|nr:hypothetical protein [Verrucomicrobiota bacterium]